MPQSSLSDRITKVETKVEYITEIFTKATDKISAQMDDVMGKLDRINASLVTQINAHEYRISSLEKDIREATQDRVDLEKRVEQNSELRREWEFLYKYRKPILWGVVVSFSLSVFTTALTIILQLQNLN